MQEAKKLENYTYQDYLDIDKLTRERVELIFGKIYMMAGASAKHQDAVGNILFILKQFAKEKGQCTPRVAPYDVKLNVDGNINVVQPDVMLFCKDNELPCAIFEVLSPSTALKDKTVKKELYEASGVKEYFLVNVEYGVVEKFELIENRYEYIKAYGVEEEIELKCIDEKILVSEIFDGIELPKIEE